MSGHLDISASGSYVDSSTENVITNIANTFVDNEQKLSETNRTDQENIQQYIHNLVSNNTNSSALKTNISTNLELCNTVDQNHDLVIDGIDASGEFNTFKYEVVNETAEKIVDEYQKYMELVQDTVNNKLDDDEFMTKAENAIANGNIGEVITNDLNETMAKKENTLDSDVDAEGVSSFRARSLFNEPYKRIEKFCIFGCAKADIDIDIKKIKSKNEATNITNDNIRNVYELALVNDSKFVNEVTNAYNQTKNVLNENLTEVESIDKRLVNNQTTQKTSADLGHIDMSGKGNVIDIKQVNQATSEIGAKSVINTITSFKATNDLRAIASDMIGVTADFGNTTSNKNETTHNNSIVNEIMNKETNSTTALHSAFGSKKTKIIVACVIGVIIVIAIIAILITKSVHANQRGKMEIDAKKEISERKLEQGFDVNVNDIGATSEITAKGEARAKEITATGEAASKVTSAATTAAVKSAIPIP